MTGLRRGKWTPEEEQYVNMVIFRFNQGTLPVPAGTTLRTYLSEKLNCDPMRITKKFTGEEAIGKRVFKAERIGARSQADLREIHDGLITLEVRWRRKLDSIQRESDRKSQRQVVLPPHIPQSLASISRSAVGMAKTAKWLDRANDILRGGGGQQQQDDYLSLAETRGLLNEGETLKRSRKEAGRPNKSQRVNNPDSSTSSDAMALFGFMKSVNERSAKTADVGELRKDDSMDNFAPLSDNYAPSATASATSSSTRSGNSSINSSANSSSSSLKTDGNKTLSPPGPPGPLSPMSTLREPSTTP